MKRALVGPVAVVLVWQTAVSLVEISPLLVPAPAAVSLATLELFRHGVLIDISWTLARLLVGLSIGSGAGVILGVLLGRFRSLHQMLQSTVDFFRSIPVAAMFPLFLVAFGIGDSSKVATIAWAVAFIVLINSMYGVLHVSPLRVMAARTLGAGRLQVLGRVVLPAALPEISVGLRQALGIGVIVALMTEMFMGTSAGLGHRIFNASLTYRIPEMYAAILLAGGLGFGLNRAFVWLESHLIHWAGK